MVRTLASACVALVILGACGGTDQASPGGSEVSVVATLYPAAFLAERIGGERVGVVELAPAGAEPHDLELTAGQVRDLTEADLVVYAGEGFQPAVEDAVADLPEDATFDILASRPNAHEDKEEEEAHGSNDHADEDHADDDHGEIDPHIWLNLEAMPVIAEGLAAHLAEADPDGAATYRANAADLIDELRDLDDDFAAGLRDCERRQIVVSHQAFGYLADRYDLEEVALAGLDPEAEPSPGRLAEVTEFAREHGITTVFYEELTSPAAAETLAAELGLETSVLSPLETRPAEGDYISAMQTNLANLRDALDCD